MPTAKDVEAFSQMVAYLFREAADVDADEFNTRLGVNFADVHKVVPGGCGELVIHGKVRGMSCRKIEESVPAADLVGLMKEWVDDDLHWAKHNAGVVAAMKPRKKKKASGRGCK